jgi:hypothetical protein
VTRVRRLARRPRFEPRDDRGQVGGIEAIPFGVLIFVVGALLVANAWAVIDAKMAVVAAAREGARTYVEAPDATAGRTLADTAAREAMTGYGRSADRLELTISPSNTFQRCQRIEVTTRYPVPAVSLPWIGGFGEGFTVRATHSEIIDPFRDGPEGVADCG